MNMSWLSWGYPDFAKLQIYDKVEEVRLLQAESTAERNHLLPAILNRAFQGQLS